MKAKRKSRSGLNDYTKGILAGDRVLLSRAITLIESNLSTDRKLADKIVEKILPASGKSIRIGITGVPGVGKSMFIETFGRFLTAQNKKVAVLAVDPSSQKTKGSILGDKTRMEELAKDPLAFIRPSPTNQSLGGVSESTRETILLCEAAGFEIILVETVGVGQSETTVRSMTDFFLLLMLPGSGDELQGIKKGIMEMADGIAITKNDNDNLKKAKLAQADFQHALHLFSVPDSGIIPEVILTSSIEKKGINEVWNSIEAFRKKTTNNGFFERQREDQNLNWFHSQVDNLNTQKIKHHKKMKTEISQLEKKIKSLKISPGSAATSLVKKWKILFPVLLLSSQILLGQNLAPAARITPNVNDLFNGMPFIRPESKVTGEIYIDSAWTSTSIELKENAKHMEWHSTRYDIQSDELEIKLTTGVKVLKGSKINEFNTRSSSDVTRKFVQGSNFKKQGVTLSGFLEVLAEGQRPLIKEYQLVIKGPNYNAALNAGSRDTQIIKDINYYYAIEGELMRIPGTKKFINSLGDHSAKVSEYMKLNDLYLNKENDLIAIFKYYNSLLQL